MGHIMVDWEYYWKIPPAEIGPSEKKNPKIHEVDEDEEECDDQDRGKGLEETNQWKRRELLDLSLRVDLNLLEIFKGMLEMWKRRALQEEM
jgi:hypothetical protein